jgi:hypothetical protein
MKKRNKIQLLVKVNLLILLVLAAFTAIYGHSEAQDTSNWKTFNNEEYGYEFKYPPDYIIEHPTKEGIYKFAEVSLMKDSNECLRVVAIPLDEGDKMILDGKERLFSTLSLKEHISERLSYPCPPYSNRPQSEFMEKLKWKPITIGGLEGMQAYGSDDKCLTKFLPASGVKKNNVLYLFDTYPKGTISYENYNKILSSFRFIK